MTIAIDLDETWKEVPDLCARFYYETVVEGHEVILITSRCEPVSDDERYRYFLPTDMPILYSTGGSKKSCAEAAGYKVDIWMDAAHSWASGLSI